MTDEHVRRAGPKGPGSRERGAEGAAPRDRPRRKKRILVASVGPPIPDVVIDRAVEVARELRADDEDAPTIRVVSVARIWGTKLGLPNPGLYPNRWEMEEQRDIVSAAARALERRGFSVTTRVVSSRTAAKAIAEQAERIGASAIVVGDPTHTSKRWERLLKGDESNDLRRRTKIRVDTVPIAPPDAKERSEALRERARAAKANEGR